MSGDSGLTVATVLYGGAETLAHTLPTWAAAAAGLPVRFVFIDNSEDESAKQVVEAQRWQPGTVDYVHSGSNVGFASGANEGLRRSSTAAVLLLNPDVSLRPGELERILGADPTSAPVAVSLLTEGRVTAGIEVSRIGWFSDRPVGSAVPCLGPSGGAALFDRAQFLELGGFTGGLFAWGEDAALALRLWVRGIRTTTLDLRLEHSGGHSVASLPGLRRKALWLARNRVWILRAQYSRPYRWTFGLLMLGLMVLNGVRKLRAGTAVAYFRGMRDGLSQPPPWTVSERMTLRAHIRYLRGAGGRQSDPADGGRVRQGRAG